MISSHFPSKPASLILIFSNIVLWTSKILVTQHRLKVLCSYLLDFLEDCWDSSNEFWCFYSLILWESVKLFRQQHLFIPQLSLMVYCLKVKGLYISNHTAKNYNQITACRGNHGDVRTSAALRATVKYIPISVFWNVWRGRS